MVMSQKRPRTRAERRSSLPVPGADSPNGTGRRIEPFRYTVRNLAIALDRKTRRSVLLSCILALVPAVIEAAAFGLLYPLLQALSQKTAVEGGAAGWLYELAGKPGYDRFVVGLGLAVFALLLV